MWLTGRLMPDFKTIADFRRDSGPAIRAACAQFVVLCRQFNLFTRAIVAIDGSKFKAVNNRDKNFTVPRSPSALSRWRPASRATWRGIVTLAREERERTIRGTDFHAAATISRHVVVAVARSTRCD